MCAYTIGDREVRSLGDSAWENRFDWNGSGYITRGKDYEHCNKSHLFFSIEIRTGLL